MFAGMRCLANYEAVSPSIAVYYLPSFRVSWRNAFATRSGLVTQTETLSDRSCAKDVIATDRAFDRTHDGGYDGCVVGSSRTLVLQAKDSFSWSGIHCSGLARLDLRRLRLQMEGLDLLAPPS